MTTAGDLARDLLDDGPEPLLRARRRLLRLRRGRAAVPGVLRVDEPLELAAVEEDPAALAALVDVDAVALVGPHRALALRAGELHARANGAASRAVPATVARVDGRALDDLRSRLWLAVVPLVALLSLPFLVLEAGPAYEARFGGGTDGVFTARDADCDDDVCTWRGDFRSDDGRRVLDDVGLIGAADLTAGDEVEAVDTGSDDAVYPADGGSNWFVITVLLAAVLVALLLWARAVRRRWRRRRPVSP